MSTHDIVIVGAGPFGLSVAAHLSADGVEHRILGRPMDTWRNRMPAGMKLRSEPYGSGIASPRTGCDLATYCRTNGLDYTDRLGPVTIERFMSYADWFTEELVPHVEDLTVGSIRSGSEGFEMTVDGGESISTRRVVVATGLMPFQCVPDELSTLPRDLMSHSSDHRDLTALRGRRVAVVGGGQSATETAALLHEAGAEVHLVTRGPALNWLAPNPERVSALGRVRRPVNNLCEGWHCAVWNSPTAFRMLPSRVRVAKARTVLGPAGAWWLRDRVEGQLEVLTSHRVDGAEVHGSCVRLRLRGPREQPRSLDVDHVIAGTGFGIDIARLPFLPPTLRAGIRQIGGSPVLDRYGESSVPGLFFAGATAAMSLGPSVRFIAGTHTSARRTASALTRGMGRTPRAASLRTRPSRASI